MNKCIVCGIEFEGRSDAKYCSTSCRKKASRVGTIENISEEIVVVEQKPAMGEFEFMAPNIRMKSGFWEDDKGEVVIRKAKYWYDVPLGAVPVAKDGEPEMPTFMNGRQYFLWRDNGFQTDEKSGAPIIVNPFPVYDNTSVKLGGERSGMWTGR